MDDGIRYARVVDEDRHDTILLAYPSPLPGNPWGVLAPLRETSWGAQIPVVRGDVLSHALHGHPTPLRRALGADPRARPTRLPLVEIVCLERQLQRCSMASNACVPGTGVLPGCYAAPSEDLDLRRLGAIVGRAWDEGRYVFVVEGEEHVVR